MKLLELLVQNNNNRTKLGFQISKVDFNPVI